MSGRIFAHGIVWDPREPLPPELEDLQATNSRSSTPRTVGTGNTTLTSVHIPTGTWRTISSGGNNVPNLPIRAGFPKTVPETAVCEPNRNVLPPLSIALNAQIIQDTARVTVTQQFWNDADVPIVKALFTFPLPTGCTLTEFSCRIGRGEILKATVKPKQDARDEFNDAILRGATTGLLEQDTPEIFTSSLGNIPPNTRLKSKITFITLLKHQFNDKRSVTTLSIPTSIASRYGEAPFEDQGSASTDVRKGLSIEIGIVDADRILQLTSNTHVISVERLAGSQVAQSFEDLAGDNPSSIIHTALVKLQDGSTSLHRDFVLDIEVEPPTGSEQPKAWLETHPTLENHRALMVTVPPHYFMRGTENEGTGEIVFLADRSGSMSDKITSLKSALNFFIKGIPLGKKFNIWSFGSGYRSLWPVSRDYTESNVREALEHVATFEADMGGTELLGALETLVKGRDTSCSCDIIILTDGQVWRLDETLNIVQRTRTYSEGNVRFFSLGIGSAVSHALVEGIAKSGGGYSEVIPAAIQDGWEDRVVAMLKAALTRHIGPIQIDTGSKADGLRDLRSPARIEFLNPFQSNRVFVLFEEDPKVLQWRTVTIKTRISNGSTLSTHVPINSIEPGDSTLHCLGARAILEDLERGRSKIHMSATRPIPGSHEEWQLVQAEMEQIACRFSIVSKWTSFFLTEGRFGSINEPMKNTTSLAVRKAGVVEPPRMGRRVFKGCGRSKGHSESKVPLVACGDDRLQRLNTCESITPRQYLKELPLVSTEVPKGPTNSSTLESQKHTSSLAEVKIYIRELLKYQKFDGSFDVDDDTLEGLLGSLAVDARSVALGKIQGVQNVSEESLRSLASTMTIMAVLEFRMHEGKEMWQLMWDKALAYIEHNLPRNADEAELRGEVVEWLKRREELCQGNRGDMALPLTKAGSSIQSSSKRPSQEQSNQQGAYERHKKQK